MARARSVGYFMTLLLAQAAAAQSPASSSSSIPISSQLSSAPSSSITSSPKTTTEKDIPLELWSLATSLLTKYYPSTTLTNLDSVTIPGTIVIGSSTYTMDHTVITKPTGMSTSTSTSKHSTQAKPTKDSTQSDVGSVAAKKPQDSMSDKTLAIVLGVVISLVAVLVMAIVFCCLWRRRKRTGSFFMSRRSPSVASSRGWVPPRSNPNEYGTTTYVTGGGSSHLNTKQPLVSTMPRGNTPDMSMHPALHGQNSRSTSDENPFYTPEERSMMHPSHHEIDGQEIQHAELDHHEPSQRRSSSSFRHSRPPTPFSPMMMQQMPGPTQRPQLHVNPFSSPEDAEADDTVSPIVPTKSPERRYSPMVHYPSLDEVSQFSFSGDERDRRYDDGGDGWRRSRPQRSNGTFELA